MKKTTIGGQALIEGIMMKGPDKTVLAVRYTDGTIPAGTTRGGGVYKLYDHRV